MSDIKAKIAEYLLSWSCIALCSTFVTSWWQEVQQSGGGFTGYTAFEAFVVVSYCLSDHNKKNKKINECASLSLRHTLISRLQKKVNNILKYYKATYGQ